MKSGPVVGFGGGMICWETTLGILLLLDKEVFDENNNGEEQDKDNGDKVADLEEDTPAAAGDFVTA